MTALPFAATAPYPAPQARTRGADTAGFATFPLANSSDSPKSARDSTRSALNGWGLGELLDDALVIVSELVTNAVRYGRPVAADHCPLAPATAAQPFLLSLVHCDGAVLCAVFDPGREVPRVKEPDFLQESGRGLHVLESLARSWGWTTPDRHGKAVWALLTSPERCADAEDDPEWEPLTRLLLLLELLSGPSWLRALGSSSTTLPGSARR
ncbi:ATP-binding protein [Streptomyces sp. NPDC127098]|uniref:ATP-binding protein n=1 Tax=Streptomyces sp. NPDC127098 TaxID=3347137 RepID=UPI00365F680D